MTYRFSPSSLGVLKDCPRCFWLQFKKGIKRPKSIFPSLPGGMDRILKEHFDRYLETGSLPPELKSVENVSLFKDKALLDRWRNTFRGIRWQDDKGNVLMGAVDNILVKENKLIVLDYKTRGWPLKEDTHTYNQDQMDFYTFLLQKEGHETKDYAYLLFYHPDRVDESGKFAFHVDIVKLPVNPGNALQIFTNALQILESDCPLAGEECQYCSFAKSRT